MNITLYTIYSHRSTEGATALLSDNAAALSPTIQQPWRSLSSLITSSYVWTLFLPRAAMHSANYAVTICLSVRPSVYPSVRPPVCPSVCLSARHTQVLCRNG